MPSILPINIGDLLRFRGVESARVELKSSWDESTTGDQIIRSICAFANDLQNLNGGYIVVGVQEAAGVAQLPPKGLTPQDIDAAQTWIRGRCKRIEPEYQPVLAPERIDGRDILVIWAPGSDTRPHSAPESASGKKSEKHYYVRLGSETVKAAGDLLTTLLQLTARVPFDDRRANNVPVEKIRDVKVREFLSDIRSGLLDESDARLVYRRMRIVAPVNGHEVPKNVGLMFFSDDPEEFFPGARLEVVQFAQGAGGDVLEERTFRGPLHSQLRDCITYLRNLSTAHVEKQANEPETKGWVSYPLAAFEEALVNAVYHRSYEGVVEPSKVYLYPDRMEIISYPGPVPGIKAEHLRPGAIIPPVPARNRRIGEFLKELRLAEARGTGVPKLFRSMEQNGSPAPRFDFDDERTYFRVTLPAHPDYVAISALRDAAHLRAIGRAEAACDRLRHAFEHDPGSGILAAALLDHCANEEPQLRIETLRKYVSAPARRGKRLVVYAVGRARVSPELAPLLALIPLLESDISDELKKTGALREALSLIEQENWSGAYHCLANLGSDMH